MGVSRVTVLNDTHAEVLGNIIAAVLLMPLCFTAPKRPFSVVLCHAVLPLAACAMLCTTVLAYDFGLFSTLIPLGSYIFFCAVAQISLALGVASIKPREFPPCITWTFYLLLFSIFSALGLLIGHPNAYEPTGFFSSSLLAPLLRSAYRIRGFRAHARCASRTGCQRALRRRGVFLRKKVRRPGTEVWTFTARARNNSFSWAWTYICLRCQKPHYF